jgi:DNA relaxase NicK
MLTWEPILVPQSEMFWYRGERTHEGRHDMHTIDARALIIWHDQEKAQCSLYIGDKIDGHYCRICTCACKLFTCRNSIRERIDQTEICFFFPPERQRTSSLHMFSWFVCPSVSRILSGTIQNWPHVIYGRPKKDVQSKSWRTYTPHFLCVISLRRMYSVAFDFSCTHIWQHLFSLSSKFGTKEFHLPFYDRNQCGSSLPTNEVGTLEPTANMWTLHRIT